MKRRIDARRFGMPVVRGGVFIVIALALALALALSHQGGERAAAGVPIEEADVAVVDLLVDAPAKLDVGEGATVLATATVRNFGSDPVDGAGTFSVFAAGDPGVKFSPERIVGDFASWPVSAEEEIGVDFFLECNEPGIHRFSITATAGSTLSDPDPGNNELTVEGEIECNPVIVGGVSLDPDASATALEASGSSGPDAGVLAGIAAGVVAVVLGGVGWYVRRRVR